MPQDLTDEDRAAIAALKRSVFVDLEQGVRRTTSWDETLYAAGLAAGREQMREEAVQRCAKSDVNYWDECAAAIRALK